MPNIANILVVDDDPDLVKLFAELFADDDRRVYSANSAEEALGLISSRPVDVVISDVCMAKMNGFELASIIRKDYPEIKIQLVSGQGGYSEYPDNVKDLVRSIINKPFHIRDLLIRVNELIADRS